MQGDTPLWSVNFQKTVLKRLAALEDLLKDHHTPEPMVQHRIDQKDGSVKAFTDFDLVTLCDDAVKGVAVAHHIIGKCDPVAFAIAYAKAMNAGDRL